jgi:hypothetical protein
MRRKPDVKEPSKIPTDVDIAWAAGFLEGEGCFKRTNVNETKFGQSVTANQVHKPPLDKLQEVFGGSLMLRNERRDNQSDIWVWAVSGKNARALMCLLRPHMSPRRQGQIDKALETLD